MILDEIAEYTKERVRALKAHKKPFTRCVMRQGQTAGQGFQGSGACCRPEVSLPS